MAALAPALLAFQAAGVDCSSIHGAFQNRLETQSFAPADLLLLAQVVMGWDAAGVVMPGALSTTVTTRMVAVAVVDAEAAQWAARKTKGIQPARHLVVAAIQDPTIPVEKAVAAADATYGALRHHQDVGSALVARAAATSDEGQARQLLEQAVRWDRPRADRTEFDSNLTTIATALPGVDDLVTELRKQIGPSGSLAFRESAPLSEASPIRGWSLQHCLLMGRTKNQVAVLPSDRQTEHAPAALPPMPPDNLGEDPGHVMDARPIGT